MQTNTQKYVINSEAWKNEEMTKAHLALEKAKSLNRPVRRAASNECEFSYELKQKRESIDNEELTTVQVAELLKISKALVMYHKNSGILPFTKVDGKLIFKKADCLKLLNEDSHKRDLLNTEEAAKYLNMKLETFQARKKRFPIPYVLKNKRNRLFKKEDLDQHIKDFPPRNMSK